MDKIVTHKVARRLLVPLHECRCAEGNRHASSLLLSKEMDDTMKLHSECLVRIYHSLEDSDRRTHRQGLGRRPVDSRTYRQGLMRRVVHQDS